MDRSVGVVPVTVREMSEATVVSAMTTWSQWSKTRSVDYTRRRSPEMLGDARSLVGIQ